MNTLDQVLLLEQKVQSAVEKIKQLQAENDALRSKCAELTNAVSSKSEQLKSFESDKSLIENGIQKALDHLNSIEYSLLERDDQVTSTPQNIEQNPVIIGNPVQENNNETVTSETFIPEPEVQDTFEEESDEEISIQQEPETPTDNHIELENKIEEAFNKSSPVTMNIPNFFGAPENFPIDTSFDSMKPVDNTNEPEEDNSSPFGNDFGTTFGSDDLDEDNPDNEIGYDFC